ncbi:MAG: hypothetical protein QNK04_21435 [Myxococcota bacterium]|nr:hypothetical protein [Myxococcota bacterium]
MFVRRGVFLSSLALLLFAGVATAQPRTFNMSGSWYQNRGPLVDIPINGGPFPCAGGQPPGRRANPQTGCQNNLRPANGGVPANGATVMATGSNPATITIPRSAFFQSRTENNPTTVAVAIVPTVVQLQSTFTLRAPYAFTSDGEGNRASIPARLIPNAPTNDPGQALRAAADFSWCPFGTGNGGNAGGPNCDVGITLVGNTVGGAPNPQCSTFGGFAKCVSTPGQRTDPPSTGNHGGTYNGLVKYVAGPNRYGGTMAMLLSGRAVVSVSGGPLGTAGGINLAAHQIAGTAIPMSQHPGRGYSTIDTDALASGPIFLGFTINFPCTMPFPPSPPGCSQIVGTGTTIGTIPADTNINVGMPWTTGVVYAFNTGTNQGAPGTTLLTAKGSLSTTGLGQGTITVVSGGTSHRIGANQDFAPLDSFTMVIGSPKTPSASPAGLAAGAVLMLLAVGYAARRRF